MDLSIVVPFHNEEENVEPLHERLGAVLDRLALDCETIFVDDGSTDRTAELLESLRKRDPRLHVLVMRRNFGQTAAFAAGFQQARGKIIITMDADLQNDPEDIPLMLEAIKDCDLVSGWRRDRKDKALTRRLPSMLANRLISLVTGVRLHDYGCSLKAYRRGVAKNLRLYGEMHRFIPAVANWYGVRVKEVEVRHHPRERGSSKYGLSRTVRVFLDLITVKFLQSFSTRPIQFFGLMGLVTGLAGFAISLYLTLEKFLYGAEIGGRPLLLLGVLLIIVGIQLVGMGLIGEMLARVYHESQDKPVYFLRSVDGEEVE